MRALSINATTKEVKELDITMEANSVYSFFNSILIDELTTLKGHVIYSDANALSEKKDALFLSEQLLIGDVLILGRRDFNDEDAHITKEELEALIVSSVNEFYEKSLALLSQTDINLYRTFTLERGGESIELNCEWVLYTFNIADVRTREYFITELQKALESGGSAEVFIQKMAGLALNAARQS